MDISLLTAKLSFIEALTVTCMTWWTSCVLFSAAVLSAMFNYRPQLAVLSVRLRWSLFSLGTVFFSNIVLFGVIVVRYLHNVQSTLRPLLPPDVPSDYYQYEI